MSIIDIIRSGLLKIIVELLPIWDGSTVYYASTDETQLLLKRSNLQVTANLDEIERIIKKDRSLYLEAIGSVTLEENTFENGKDIDVHLLNNINVSEMSMEYLYRYWIKDVLVIDELHGDELVIRSNTTKIDFDASLIYKYYLFAAPKHIRIQIDHREQRKDLIYQHNVKSCALSFLFSFLCSVQLKFSYDMMNLNEVEAFIGLLGLIFNNEKYVAFTRISIHLHQVNVECWDKKERIKLNVSVVKLLKLCSLRFIIPRDNALNCDDFVVEVIKNAINLEDLTLLYFGESFSFGDELIYYIKRLIRNKLKHIVIIKQTKVMDDVELCSLMALLPLLAENNVRYQFEFWWGPLARRRIFKVTSTW